jgi:hypothetical protein
MFIFFLYATTFCELNKLYRMGIKFGLSQSRGRIKIQGIRETKY